jgi:hypothetical protein
LIRAIVLLQKSNCEQMGKKGRMNEFERKNLFIALYGTTIFSGIFAKCNVTVK